MVDRHATDPPDELEVVQVVLIVGRRLGADLQRVVIAGRVLKETGVRIEHLVGEQVEPLPEGRGGEGRGGEGREGRGGEGRGGEGRGGEGRGGEGRGGEGRGGGEGKGGEGSNGHSCCINTAMYKGQPTINRSNQSLPRESTIVQAGLPLEPDVESGLQVLHVPDIHDGVVRVLKEVVPANRKVKRVGNAPLHAQGEARTKEE